MVDGFKPPNTKGLELATTRVPPVGGIPNNPYRTTQGAEPPAAQDRVAELDVVPTTANCWGLGHGGACFTAMSSKAHCAKVDVWVFLPATKRTKTVSPIQAVSGMLYSVHGDDCEAFCGPLKISTVVQVVTVAFVSFTCTSRLAKF